MIQAVVVVLLALTSLTAARPVAAETSPPYAPAPEAAPDPVPEPNRPDGDTSEAPAGFAAPNIIGGTPTPPDEFPFVVGVLQAGVADPFDAQYCAGTLIAPTVVLTAAHCVVSPAAAGGLDVLVGTHDLTSGGQRIDVDTAITHPTFRADLPLTYDHDYAVLHLAQPAAAPTVRLVGIGEEAAWSPGTDATVVGWGTDGDEFTEALHGAEVPIVSDSDCLAAYPADLYPQSMVCAGLVGVGGVDACQGDSGGPLLVPDPDDLDGWLQVGIVSWGIGCALPDYPGVYSEIAQGRPWIDSYAEPRARFHPATPTRILDTRRPADGPSLGAGTERRVPVAGLAGVPDEDVTSVVLNVTVTGPTAASHLTVWPGGQARPTASNLNYVAGQTVANMVVARLGADGSIALRNKSGNVHAVVDVLGWFDDGRSPTGARATATAPTRLFDTRKGDGGVPQAPVGPAETVTVDVAGHAGVPAVGASAVVINLTGTDASEATNLTLHPGGTPRPHASNLNLVPGRAVANLAVVELGVAGDISVFNRAGTTEVIADVVGWFGTPDGATGDAVFTGLTPVRLLDTRSALGGAEGPVGAGQAVSFVVAGAGGVPATADAVVLNLTIVGPTSATHLTAYPAGTAPPLASNLNALAGWTVPNLVVVPIGDGGRVFVRNNSGAAYVIADVVGFFSS